LNYIDAEWAGFGWEYVEVTVHYEPPATVEFDVKDDTPEPQRRILIHNSRRDYAYPSGYQVATSDSERPRFTVSGKVTSGVRGLETDLWLRVLDPADSSPYLPSSMQHIDDNMDTKPRGLLIPVNCIADCTPADSIKIHSAADGSFAVRLEGTDRYAGDNYVIEGGLDADFSCRTAGPGQSNVCGHTGVITAWKRIFLEKHLMLRNGISFAAPARVGDTSIRVVNNRYGGNQGRSRISKGDRIVLVHGPSVDRRNVASGSYYEEHTVESVTKGNNDYAVSLGTKTGNQVTPEPLSHDFGPDPSNPTEASLADSIAALSATNLSPADLFDSSDGLITNSVFPEAFTEYVVLPSPASGVVPVPNFGDVNERRLQAFADKWNTSVGPDGRALSNHQLLLIGDNDKSATADATGVTVSRVPGQMSSWVWRGVIETAVTTRGGAHYGENPDAWAAKTSVHELAHEWKTDSAFGLIDHCPKTTKTFNDSSLYCLLAAHDAAGAETQRANGIARFHMLPLPGGGWHSEYFEIRRQPDPFVP
jgi:hypothetical protein